MNITGDPIVLREYSPNLLCCVQVLDLGFNLLRTIPDTAFSGINSLTLLALDGNPMASLPEAAFTHLNASLKGLSVGGRFLTCDCRYRVSGTAVKRNV